MKTVIIEYATIPLFAIAARLFHELNCSVTYKDMDKEFYELSVYDCRNMVRLENILAEYV